MPIIKRSEINILRFKKFVNIFVNPCNNSGNASAGLSLAYRNSFGEDMFTQYRRKCLKNKLFIGSSLEYKDKNGVRLIHIPTKSHFADATDIDGIKKGLCALREYLLKYPKDIVVTPMIGCSLGQIPKSETEPLNYEYLDDLPNMIYASMLPKVFKSVPKYLSILSDNSLTDIPYIKDCINISLSKWELNLKDFDGIIIDDKSTLLKLTSVKNNKLWDVDIVKTPIIKVSANFDKYGRTSSYMKNHVITDLATHMVAIADERKTKSLNIRQAASSLKKWNEVDPNFNKVYEAFLLPK